MGARRSAAPMCSPWVGSVHLIAGYGWTWDVGTSGTIEAEPEIDVEPRTILLTAVQQDADSRYQSIEEMSAGGLQHIMKVLVSIGHHFSSLSCQAYGSNRVLVDRRTIVA